MEIESFNPPTKSAFDKKDYRLFKLPNQLLTLLVSDPIVRNHQDRLAACALKINVGYFNDLRNMSGLAHFLQHMICMGSKKYPNENEYETYVKSCGGESNAATGAESTFFYFTVDEKYLQRTMKRFAAQFAKPMLKKTAIERQHTVVELEVSHSMEVDAVIRDKFLAGLARPGHPCHGVEWNNWETWVERVSKDKMQRILHNFWKKYYSANRMYLCVQAGLPLDELQEMVAKFFSVIPCNNLPLDDFSCWNFENTFSEEFYTRVYFLKSVSNRTKLELTWCLPPFFLAYKCKPHIYISYVLSYGGPGGLATYLKKRCWALSTTAEFDPNFGYNSLFSLFVIRICLTDKGLDHITEVLRAVFSYVRLLKKCGPRRELFTELQLINCISFHFHREQGISENILDLLGCLSHYPSEDLLTGPNLMFKYDESAIWDVIRLLNEAKFNIMITSNRTHEEILRDNSKSWSNDKYTYIEFPLRWALMWDNLKPIPELYFPPPNVFVPGDFRIFWKELEQTTVAQYPRKIIDNELCEVWFKEDSKYLRPVAYMFFYFMTPLPRKSAKSSVLNLLYYYLLKNHLDPHLFPASVAGVEYELHPTNEGLALMVSGYNDKLHLIIDIVTKHMKLLPEALNKLQVRMFKEQVRQDLQASLRNPSALNTDLRRWLLLEEGWSMVDKYNVLHDITLGDVKDFLINFTAEMKIQCLVQGNLLENTVSKTINSILRNFKCSEITNPKMLENRACQIPLGSHYLKCQSLKTDFNTVLVNYYQVGPATLRQLCMSVIMATIMEMELFQFLHMSDFNCHHVAINVQLDYGVLGYVITVHFQEKDISADLVEKQVESINRNTLNALQNISQCDFERIREMVIKSKQAVDRDLKDEVKRHWSEIIKREYVFDRREREVECLRAINKEDIIKFFKEIEAKNNFKKLSIQVIGNMPRNSGPIQRFPNKIQLNYIEDDTTIESILKFKKDLRAFPAVVESEYSNKN